MKNVLLIIVLLFIPILCFTQTKCEQIMALGDAAFKNEQYREAILKYIAGKNCNPLFGITVDKKILAVFDKIERLQKKADSLRWQAEMALKQ